MQCLLQTTNLSSETFLGISITPAPAKGRLSTAETANCLNVLQPFVIKQIEAVHMP